jgi:hypothetical protein
MYPTVPPPQAVMPRPNANDAKKAIDQRPTKLNFMRFLHHPSGISQHGLCERGNLYQGEYKP